MLNPEDRQVERLRQLRLLTTVACRIQTAMRKEFRWVAREVREAYLRQDGTADIIAGHEQRVADIIADNADVVFQRMGRDVAKDMKAQKHVLGWEVKQDEDDSQSEEAALIAAMLLALQRGSEAYRQNHVLGAASQIARTTNEQVTMAVTRQEQADQDVIGGIIGGATPGRSVEIDRDAIRREGAGELSRIIIAGTAARAGTIGRTESGMAVSTGADEAVRAAVDAVAGLTVTKTWTSRQDDRVRDFDDSDFSHVMADGQVRQMTEDFQIARKGGGTESLRYPRDPNGSPGNVINCLLPDSTVGRIAPLAGTRHAYSGNAVRISLASGNQFAVTMNHPILSTQGWISAGEIVKNAHLVADRSNVHLAEKDLHVETADPTAAEVFNALHVSGNAVRIAAGVVDFHGDRPTADVDVVRSNGLLTFGSDVSKGIAQFGLTDTDVSRIVLHGLSVFGLGGIALFGAPDGIVCCPSDRLATVRAKLLHPALVGIGCSVGLEAGNEKPIINDVPVHAEIPADLTDSQTGRVQFADLTANGGISTFGDELTYTKRMQALRQCAYGNASHFAGVGDGDACLVGFDRVVDVHVFHYDGPVYNFESEAGYYTTAGIVNHNCRCIATHRVERGS